MKKLFKKIYKIFTYDLTDFLWLILIDLVLILLDVVAYPIEFLIISTIVFICFKLIEYRINDNK